QPMAHYDQNQKEVTNRGPGQPASAATRPPIPVIANPGPGDRFRRNTQVTGLTPSEYSSGARTRRGGITKAGPQLIRSTLIEAAWAYRHRPAIGATLRRRQAGCPAETLARSWK